MDNLSNIYYNDEHKIKIIITNLLKMLMERKLLNNLDSLNKIISEFKVSNTYNLKLHNTDRHNNNTYQIVFLNETITSTAKNSSIINYLKNNAYTIFIVENISLKHIQTLKSSYNNVEIFTMLEFTINLIDSVYIPKHILLTSDEKKQFLEDYSNIKESQLAKIFLIDPMSKYYGAQVGDIFRIIRPSEITGESVYYRLVI